MVISRYYDFDRLEIVGPLVMVFALGLAYRQSTGEQREDYGYILFGIAITVVLAILFFWWIE